MGATWRLRIFAAAALAFAAVEVFDPLLLGTLDAQLLDAFVRHHAQKLAPDPDLVLFDVDDASLAKLQDEANKRPWPRIVHAQLVEGIAAQKPKPTVVDMVFSERVVFRKEGDATFADSVACALDMAENLLAFKRELGGVGEAFDVGVGPILGPRSSARSAPISTANTPRSATP